jgi:general secretion pathway protein D
LSVSKVAELERTIRDRIEASRPKPAIQEMRERVRAATAEPVLNPASREPLRMDFPNTSLRDVLNFLANATGINVTYDRDVQDRLVTIKLDGVTLEQALNQIMTMNTLSYKILSERSIFVFPDTGPKHAVYDEQVVRTFYVSHADATELVQTLGTIMRMPGMAIQPAIIANKTANTITVRATASVVQIIEKIIQQNDKPRAEIVLDVEILEVDRSRTKAYGINLSDYSLGTIFSPETAAPSAAASATTTGTGTGTTTTLNTGQPTPPSQIRSPAPFNLNTISRGVSTSDFYLAVPTAIVNFLESDSHTRIIAKPQVRGAEGAKFTLKLGDKVPVISTSYTPIATGGAGVNPLSSYQYQDVGVNLDITPRVTLEGDIIMDLTVEDTSRKADVVIAGVNIPSFGQRTVTTRLRLRDGESNLLAGLLQENTQDSVKGFPGAIHVPVLKQLFSGNNKSVEQTDIVMLLTPHIVRTQEITEDDLKPLYIGSQQNLGVGGPPPLIAAPADAIGAVGQAPAAGAPQPGFATVTPPGEIVSSPNPQRGPGGTTVSAPPGSSPVPGTVLVTPPAPTPPPANVVPVPPPDVAPQPATPPAQPVTPAPPPAPAAATPPPAAPGAPVAPPTTTSGLGSAQVLVTPPPTIRVGGGPYTVPISIADASRITTVTLTLIYDPTKLRVRSVQEGSFMRAGGAAVSFSQQVTGNRIDITLARGGDGTGASGTGLLAAILFDAIAPGTSSLTLNGTANGPGGVAMGLRFTPVMVTVQ